MNDFELVDQGDGRFSLNGRMTFETAGDILRASEEPFEQHTRIEVSLGGVNDSDSAALALLLEWITWANHTVREITFTDVPDRINAIDSRMSLDTCICETPTRLPISDCVTSS